MAFPANEKDVEVAFAYGANLATSLASLTYGANLAPTHVKPRLTISRGRIGDSTQTQPTEISFGLKNPGGIFSPRNIAGPNYGRLRRNTPVRARLDPGGGMVTRGIAYMPDWPTRWTGPDIDDQISMVASGALRQLGSGKDPKSAPRRYLPGTSAVAVWPLEDGELVEVGAPDVGAAVFVPFEGTHPSGAIVTTPRWSAGTLAPWLPPVLALSGNQGLGIMWAPVVMTSTTTWTVDIYYRAGADSNRVWVDINPSYLPDGVSIWPQLAFNAIGREIVVAHPDGSPEAVTSVPGLYDDRLHHVRWTLSQSGANSASQVWVDGLSVATSTSPGAASVTAVRTIALGAEQSGDTGSGSVAVGHLGVWVTGPTLSTAVLVSQGWAGETDGARVARLCAEEGITSDVIAGSTTPMGPQDTAPIVDLLRACETAGFGTLIERRTGEVGYDPRPSRYNKAVTMTVNYLTQVADLLPDDDDRDLINYVVASRINGASVIDEREDGPLGTDPATGVGRYPGTAGFSLASDDQLTQHASYIVRRGTVDEPRYTVVINLRAHPELIAQWLACDVGSRILVNNPPAIQVGPAPLDLVIEGYTELIDGVEWVATIYATPYRINEVFQIESTTGNRGRLSPTLSTLDLGYSATATTLSVTSTVVRWIDSATFSTQFPIAIEVAGEAMTCTAITGTGLTQTFTVVRGLHGVSKPLPIGTSVQLWRAPVVAL